MDKSKESVESQEYNEKRKRFAQFAKSRDEVKTRLRSAKTMMHAAQRELELASGALRDLDMDVAASREKGASSLKVLMEDAMAQIVDCWRTPEDLADAKNDLADAIKTFEGRVAAYLVDDLNTEDLLDNYFGRLGSPRSRADMADLLEVDEEALRKRRSRASKKVRKNRESIKKAREADPNAFLGIRRPPK